MNIHENRTPKNFTEWQALRRKNPNLYYSNKAQRLIVADREALGEAFYDKKNAEDL